MAALPSHSLRNRTFVGLLVAQFLAAFNDQAIHAAAMFFALNTGTLHEATAITLMPILFYSPWAIFVTLAAYYADRYSKQRALRAWKFAEVGITLVATVGFYLGSVHHSPAGPWVVLGCVFLMGLHSAFFVPAKYGAMPEILQPQLLSRGNGILESLSFMAIILGTVSGGMLSSLFRGRETVIGLVLVALAAVGAVASLLIERMPPANPTRPFPKPLYGPLAESLRVLIGSRPLRLAVIGIAFFTFVVAFMRATVYLLGESQNPRWSEFHTSVVVGMSALGIGLGSPLAGWLSGRKVELGLVPLGAVGMILAGVAAAVVLARLTGPPMQAGLVACIVAIGFCTGFYLVPMYTLLQHRAPKTAKGDAVATSNFINVVGAMLASGVAAGVVALAHATGVTPVVAGHADLATGILVRAVTDKHGRVQYVEVRNGDNRLRKLGDPPPEDDDDEDTVAPLTTGQPRATVIKYHAAVSEGQPVAVSGYKVRGVAYFLLRPANQPLPTAYDEEPLPRYLFLGAALVTLAILLILMQQMPDLLSRAAWVLRAGKQTRRLHAVGTHFLPAVGPVVLVTNCRDEACYRNVNSATERTVRLVRSKLTEDRLGEELRAVHRGAVLALAADAVELLPLLRARLPATYLPVYYGPSLAGDGTLRVAFGPPLGPDADASAAIRAAGAMPDEETE